MISEHSSKPEKPALLPAGNVTVKFTYDGRGNIVRQTYHGMNDEPVLLKGRLPPMGSHV